MVLILISSLFIQNEPQIPTSYVWHYQLPLLEHSEMIEIQPQAFPVLPTQIARLNTHLSLNEGKLSDHNFSLSALMGWHNGRGKKRIEFSLTYQARTLSGELTDMTSYLVAIQMNVNLVQVKAGSVNRTFPVENLTDLRFIQAFYEFLAAPNGPIKLKVPQNKPYIVDLLWDNRIHKTQELKNKKAFEVVQFNLRHGHRHPLGSVFVFNGKAFYGDYWRRINKAGNHMVEAFQSLSFQPSTVHRLEQYLSLCPSDAFAIEKLIDYYLEQDQTYLAKVCSEKNQPLLPYRLQKKVENQYVLHRQSLLKKLEHFEPHQVTRLSFKEPKSLDLVGGSIDIELQLNSYPSPLLKIQCFLGSDLIATFDKPPYRTRIQTHGTGQRELKASAYFYDQTYCETKQTLELVPIDQEESISILPLRAVATHRNEPIEHLNAEDFQASSDGQHLNIKQVIRETKPSSMVLVLDISRSMLGEKLIKAQEAVFHFLSNLHPEDQVELIAFDHKTLRLVPFSSQLEDFLPTLFSLDARGGTALYDAIWIAQEDLKSVGGNPVIIAISDGRDFKSSTKLMNLKAELKQSGTIFYALFLEETNTDVRGLAIDSGGRHARVERFDNMGITLSNFYKEIKSFYFLEVMTPKDLSPNRVNLNLRRKGTLRFHHIPTRQL